MYECPVTQPISARAPVDVAIFFEIEDELVRHGGLRQIAARRMLDALRLRRRSARVEQEQQVFGVHRLGLALGRLARDDLIPPVVSAFVHEDVVADAPRHDAMRDGRRLLHRDVAVALERDLMAPPPAVIGGNQGHALRVVDAVYDRFGREAAEDHRMRRADARAGEHGDRQFGNHRHVDRNAIAAPNAELAQPVGKAADSIEQLAIGDGPAVAGLAFVIIRDLLAAAGSDVAVEAVDGNVQLPSPNQRANGSFHSSATEKGVIHSSVRAHEAQNST